ncbi:hypothetical protein COLO4_17382 [Corchorus olitorius]|uniref:Uncharacterized protein n=1 Tax=Corchorus olitorius TaxID=93759 RepID=A0A1R3JCZ2_9ROSI|nr:hypothetical protein COLO4_17382 [Corchorus olitorius]
MSAMNSASGLHIQERDEIYKFRCDRFSGLKPFLVPESDDSSPD